jgi:hypothetical protein
VSRIKECFVTRFPEGALVEADFSQLEVIGLAALSQDPQLIEDLRAGRDMHRFFAAQLYNKTEEEVTKAERTLTKRFTFQLQYGGGAQGLAKKNRVSVEIAKRFIETYYGRYYVVKDWQDTNVDLVQRSRTDSGQMTPGGNNMGRGSLISPTGREYVFFEQDPQAGFRRQEPSFNPPEIKNYPVQGFATGDVMAIYRGMVLRDLIAAGELDNILPINTVHDSVMYDCRTQEHVRIIHDILKDNANALIDLLEDVWGIEVPVPFNIEVSQGPTWADQTVINTNNEGN